MNLYKEHICSVYPFFNKNKWEQEIIDCVTAICKQTDISISNLVSQYENKKDKSNFIRDVLSTVLHIADESIYKNTDCVELVEFVTIENNKICWLWNKEKAEASFIKWCKKNDCFKDINMNNPCVKYVFEQIGFDINKYK